MKLYISGGKALVLTCGYLKVAGETPFHVTGYANIEVYGNITINTCFPCGNTNDHTSANTKFVRSVSSVRE